MEITKFHDLNDDCIEELFRSMGIGTLVFISRTCKRFEWIAERQLRRIKFYNCTVSNDTAEISEIISVIGKYLHGLSLCFEMDVDYDDTVDEVDEGEHFAGFDSNGVRRFLKQGKGLQFFKLLCAAVGKNLRTLNITGSIHKMPIYKMVPVFMHLECLSLCVGSTHSYFIDLPALCPNLKRLKISGSVVFAPNPDKAFDHLVSLSISNIVKHDGQSKMDFFIPFLKQNKQLEELRIEINYFLDNPTEMQEFIENLDERKANFIFDVDHLDRLKEISNQLANKNVQSITLDHWFSNYEEKLPKLLEIITEWNQIKFFEMGYTNGGEKIAVEVVRIAKNLEKIRVGPYSSIPDQLIMDIAKARERAVGIGKPPLKICFHTRSYEDNLLTSPLVKQTFVGNDAIEVMITNFYLLTFKSF